MKDFFEGIASLFEDYLFIPFDFLRLDIQQESWLLANTVNFLFIIIGFVFFLYWMRKLKVFSKTENTDGEDEVYLI